MIVLQYDELFAPYAVNGHTLEKTLENLASTAAQKNISTDVLKLAIKETFVEIANGEEFPKDECPCGCNTNRATISVIHTILARMYDIDAQNTAAVKDLMQQRYQTLVAGKTEHVDIEPIETEHVGIEPIEPIKMERLPLSERSPVLRVLKKIFKKRVG